jgi:hypothetical protein
MVADCEESIYRRDEARSMGKSQIAGPSVEEGE